MSDAGKRNGARPVPAGVRAVLAALACPHCGQVLDADDGALVCLRGHSFDIARQGYVALLASNAAHLIADDAEMIAARERFFATGHYDTFLAEVASAAARVDPDLGPILDCGAGEGSYLIRALDSRGGVGIGLDLSKPAARRLARRDPRVGAVVANSWDRMPLADSSIGVIISAFAPRNSTEFARTLHPDGRLVVLTPTAKHLREIVEPLGMISVESGKVARLDRVLHERFELIDRHSAQWLMELTPAALADLVAMGPSAHHGSPSDRESAIAALVTDGAALVTASGTISEYRHRP